MLYGDNYVAHNARKTHCPRGHAYSPKNTYVYRNRRNCRTCTRENANRSARARYWADPVAARKMLRMKRHARKSRTRKARRI